MVPECSRCTRLSIPCVGSGQQRYKFMDHAAIEFGIDNVGDYKYFMFHPFPGRTFVASLKATF